MKSLSKLVILVLLFSVSLFAEVAEWQNDITYNSGEQVVYQGKLYVAQRNVFENTPPIENDSEWFWVCLGNNNGTVPDDKEYLNIAFTIPFLEAGAKSGYIMLPDDCKLIPDNQSAFIGSGLTITEGEVEVRIKRVVYGNPTSGGQGLTDVIFTPESNFYPDRHDAFQTNLLNKGDVLYLEVSEFNADPDATDFTYTMKLQKGHE